MSRVLERFRRRPGRPAHLTAAALVVAAVFAQASVPLLQGLHHATHALECTRSETSQTCIAPDARSSLVSAAHVADDHATDPSVCPVCQAVSHAKAFAPPAPAPGCEAASSATSVVSLSYSNLGRVALAAAGPRGPPALS